LSNETLWDQSYESLLRYGAQYKHYNVPFYFSFSESSSKLGKWLDKQRQSYKLGENIGI